MAALPGSSPPRGVISVGDALAVLVALAPEDAETRRALCGLLGYEIQTLAPLTSLTKPPGEGLAPQHPGTEPPALPDDSPPPDAPPVLSDTEPEAMDLPPVSRGNPPDLLQPLPDVPQRDPFAPQQMERWQTLPQPRRLLAPQYERNVLRAVCLIERQSSELDLEQVIARLSAGEIVERPPYRRVRKPAPRVDIWHDVSDSMTPFAADQAQLVKSVQKAIGSRVRSHYAAGLLPATPAMLKQLRLRDEGIGKRVVLLASDLGFGGAPRQRLWWRTTLARLHGWAAHLRRYAIPLAAFIPCPRERWEQHVPRGMRPVYWAQTTRPGRIQPVGQYRPWMGQRAMTSAPADGPFAVVPESQLQRLGRAASFAMRVTPTLLRELRLTVLSHLGPEAEAEFWAVRWVRNASQDACTMEVKMADTLRGQIPSYAWIIGWLGQVAPERLEAERDALALYRPINDGWQDLWPRQGDGGAPPMAPRYWPRALRALARILSEGSLSGALLARWPTWTEEIEALIQGQGAVFGEQVREIVWRTSQATAHLHFEDSVRWYAYLAQHEQAGADQVLDRLLGSAAQVMLDPLQRQPAQRALQWAERRLSRLPLAVRQREAFARLRTARHKATGLALTAPGWREMVDVYLVPEAEAQLRLSLEPLPGAYRIRAEVSEGVQLTIEPAGTFDATMVPRVVVLRPAAAVSVPLPTQGIVVRTTLDDAFAIPGAGQPVQAPSLPFAGWMTHVAEEHARRDWLALMRWAAQAARSGSIPNPARWQTELAFARASALAGRRVDEAHTALEHVASESERAAPGEADSATALALAAADGNTVLVQLLIEYGTVVNPRFDVGRTPLMLAAQHGHAEIVRLLLANGAQRDSVAWDGQTALRLAQEHGHEEIVRLLTMGGGGGMFVERWEPDTTAGALARLGLRLQLASARVDLLALDSRLREACAVAEPDLAALRDVPPAWRDAFAVEEALLRFQVLDAFLRRGEHEAATREVATAAERTRHVVEHYSGTLLAQRVAGWHAVMKARLAGHRGVRREMKKARGALAAVPQIADDRLLVEKAVAEAGISEWLFPIQDALSTYEAAIRLALRYGDVRRATTVRLAAAHVLFNGGAEAVASQIVGVALDSLPSLRGRALHIRGRREHAYQLRFISYPRAIQLYNVLLQECPPDESIAMDAIASEVAQCFAQPLNFPYYQQGILGFLKHGRLGHFAHYIGSILFRDDAEWAREALAQVADGQDTTEQAVALVRRIGPSLASANLLRNVAASMDDHKRAQRLLARSAAIATALGIWGTCVLVEITAADHAIKQWRRTKEAASLDKAENRLTRMLTTLEEKTAAESSLTHVYAKRGEIRLYKQNYRGAAQDAEAARDVASRQEQTLRALQAMTLELAAQYFCGHIAQTARLTVEAGTLWEQWVHESEQVGQALDLGEAGTQTFRGDPLDYSFNAMRDVLESLRQKHQRGSSPLPTELALANLAIHFLTEQYQPRLLHPASAQGNAFYILRSWVDLLRGMDVPNERRAYEILLAALPHQRARSRAHLAGRFQRELDRLNALDHANANIIE